MDPISNIDRIVVILRQRLAERARSSSTGRKDQSAPTGQKNSSGLDNIQALAAAKVDERQLRRLLVQHILADQIDPRLINDSKFQLVVDQVTAALEQNPEGRALLDRVLAELR